MYEKRAGVAKLGRAAGGESKWPYVGGTGGIPFTQRPEAGAKAAVVGAETDSKVRDMRTL